MARKCGVWLLSVVFVPVVLMLGGCETVKGTVYGAGATVGGTCIGAAKDTRNTYNVMQRIDNWMRKNMW